MSSIALIMSYHNLPLKTPKIRNASSMSELEPEDRRTFRAKRLFTQPRKRERMLNSDLVPTEVIETIQETKEQIDQALTYFYSKMKYNKQLEETKLLYLNKIGELEGEVHHLKHIHKLEENKLRLEQQVADLHSKYQQAKEEAQRFCSALLQAKKKISCLQRQLGDAVKANKCLQKDYESLFRKYRMEAKHSLDSVTLSECISALMKSPQNSVVKTFCKGRSQQGNDTFLIQLGRYIDTRFCCCHAPFNPSLSCHAPPA